MKCHTPTNIRDQAVITLLREHPHRSFLGLSPACSACHASPHPPNFSKDCSSCHSAKGWKEIAHFDHSSTRFPLEGRHAAVPCEKCHNEPQTDNGKRTMPGPKSFADCTPCHQSPHSGGLNAKECRSCHSAGRWDGAMQKPFDHSLTRFILRGRHAAIRCEGCHKGPAEFSRRFRPAFRTCTDCHEDAHHGQFLAAYKNDCSRCHTEQAYTPSTFDIARHVATRFPLTGAHAAVPCRQCHRGSADNGPAFRFAALTCESCHRDVHGGKMKAPDGNGCRSCHSTERWKPARFDHSPTGFPLTGKHMEISCSACHTEFPELRSHPADCESCHSDRHAAQFASEGRTQCERCHSTDSWHGLVFNHQTQSSFPLTGKHASLTCSQCHHQETVGSVSVVRYKPLKTDCSACHAGRKGGE